MVRYSTCGFGPNTPIGQKGALMIFVSPDSGTSTSRVVFPYKKVIVTNADLASLGGPCAPRYTVSHPCPLPMDLLEEMGFFPSCHLKETP